MFGGRKSEIGGRKPRGRPSRRERASVVVVESGGEIAWVAGVATSDSFKVTEETRETVRLTVRERNHRHAQACP